MFEKGIKHEMKRSIKRSMIHHIHDGKGGERVVKLTPFRAIRYFCLECMCGNMGEVERCSAPLCPLFPYRLGSGHEPDVIFDQSPLWERGG